MVILDRKGIDRRNVFQRLRAALPFATINLVIVVVLIFGGGLIAYFIDQLAVHRIHSFSDIEALSRTKALPRLSNSPRCLVQGTEELRCLPNLFLIGASKAGTTSLARWLAELPHVYFEKRFLSEESRGEDKHTEVHRFDRPSYGRASKTIELLSQWAASPIVRSEWDLVVHYTPHYLYAPSVPFELRDLYPPETRDSLRFVVLVRDPIERAWSSFWFKNSHLFQGEDRGSVEEFVTVMKSEINERRRFERCFEREMSHALSLSFSNHHSVIADTEERTASKRYIGFLMSIRNRLVSCQRVCPPSTAIAKQRETNRNRERQEEKSKQSRQWRDRENDKLLDLGIRRNLVYENKNEKTELHRRYYNRENYWQSRCGTNALSLFPSSSFPLHSRLYNDSLENEALRTSVFNTLEKCFGSEHFRSKKLGWRHLDKGLYIDQILRWQINFFPDQFLFISTSALASAPKDVMQRILTFATQESHAAKGKEKKKKLRRMERETVHREIFSGLRLLDFSRRYLEKPNKHAKGLNESLLESERELLQEFVRPYNYWLFKELLCDV